MGVELYALGGLAVRYEKWSELRELALQQTETTGGETWLRQAQVASLRAAEYEESFLELASHRLLDIEPQINAEAARELVARFDLLSGLLIIIETEAGRFYPNAAEFSEALVEPIVIDQLRSPDTALRRELFPHDSDSLREALDAYDALALDAYDALARSQAAIMRFWGRNWEWRSFADGRTWAFITEGSMLERLPRLI